MIVSAIIPDSQHANCATSDVIPGKTSASNPDASKCLSPLNLIILFRIKCRGKIWMLIFKRIESSVNKSVLPTLAQNADRIPKRRFDSTRY